jgi:hypothetical protein
MRIKHVLMSLGIALSAVTAMAQVEDDDMYFNAKDRERLRAAQASETVSQPAFAKASDKTYDRSEEEETVNPTDSYSSRTVNPEFEARSLAEVATDDEENYFVNNYQSNTAQNLNNFNDNYSSWNSNPWYNSNYYGSSINNWNSPYYGSNSPYSSPWANPYWGNSGWSASFSYYWGNNYGYWNPYNQGYNPYNPYAYGYGYNACGASYGAWYGSGYGYNSYPGTIVVVNNGDYTNRVTYGKRSPRGGTRAPVSGNTDRSTRNRDSVVPSENAGGNQGGRVSANSTTRAPRHAAVQEEYYSNKPKTRSSGRSVSTYASDNDDNYDMDNSSQGSSNTYKPRTSSSGNNNSGSTYTPPSRSSNSGSGNSGSTYTPPTRSSSSGSGSSYTPPSRSSSSGGSSSGSSSGGSRGRTRGN